MNLKCNLGMLSLTLIMLILAPLSSRSAAAELPYLELNRPDRGKVFAIAWSPDGQYIAVGTEQGLWIYTDTFADVTHADDKPIHALAWSPDGNTIAAGYFGEETDIGDIHLRPIRGGGLRLWSVTKANSTVKLTTGTRFIRNGSVYSLRFNPAGNQLAALVQIDHDIEESLLGDDKLQIFAVESGILLRDAPTQFTFAPQDDSITQGANGLDWTQDDRLTLIRNVNDNDPREFSILGTVNGNVAASADDLDHYEWAGILTAVGWSSDGTQLAISSIPSPDPNTWGGISVCDRDGSVCVAPPVTVEDTAIYDIAHIDTLAWHPQRPLLAYSQNTSIRLWNATTQQLEAELNAAQDVITMLIWKPDGSALLSAGSDFVVRLWTRFASYQRPDPQPFKTIALPPQSTPSGWLSPDGKWRMLLSGEKSKSPYLALTNLENGNKRMIPMPLDTPDEHAGQSFAWSPDSKMLVRHRFSDHFGCDNFGTDTEQLWSVETGKLLLDLGLINGLAWRPDNQAIAVGRYIGDEVFVIELWDVTNGKLLQTSSPSDKWGKLYPYLELTYFHNHYLKVSGWSPDGRLVDLYENVECGSYAPTSAKLWEPESNRIVGELITSRTPYGGSGNSASVFAWSPDGTLAAVSGFFYTGLYRLTWQGDHINSEVIWRPVGASYEGFSSAFSPDSHYFLYGTTVLDTRTLWPVFKFRNDMSTYIYQWVGDTLIGVRTGDQTIQGEELYIHTSDFLPHQ